MIRLVELMRDTADAGEIAIGARASRFRIDDRFAGDKIVRQIFENRFPVGL